MPMQFFGIFQIYFYLHRILSGTEENAGGENPEGQKKNNRKKHLEENISFEDQLKALTLTPEGANNALKTPVSVLQELLSRRGITPTYDLIQIEGVFLFQHLFRLITQCSYEKLLTSSIRITYRCYTRAHVSVSRNIWQR